jgi:hypothetical protein
MAGISMQTFSSSRPTLLAIGLLVIMTILGHSARAESENQTRFKRIAPQWVAALGDPSATSGSGAEFWGLWRKDPGPRGVKLESYEILKATNGLAPARWKFDENDWWVEEHGLIMEKPEFPLPPGKYIVTGDRWVKAVLTVHPKNNDGAQRWELDKGVKLYDVTHLPCRSARYISATSDNSCSPANAQMKAFPVAPGAAMPEIEGCKKQDYAVLIVIGVAVGNELP